MENIAWGDLVAVKYEDNTFEKVILIVILCVRWHI